MQPLIGNNENQASFSFSPNDDESALTTNYENEQKTSNRITIIPAGTEVIPAYQTTKIIINEDGSRKIITKITDAVKLMFDLEL